MTRVELAVLLYALLLWQAWGAEFSITSLSIGGVNQTVAASSMQSFVDIHTMTRASSEFYLAVMQLQNSGPYQLNVLGFDIQLYSGAFLSYIPPAAQTITAVNASKAVSNSPVISSGGMWPGGIQFLIPASNFPPTTTCSPYDVTIESNITFKYGTLGKVGVDRLLLPISVTPMCLTRTGTSSGDQLKVSIEFSSPHLQAYKSFLPFMIDFGDKILELDPLKLVKVVGSDRIDYVYDVDRGKVYLMVYPNSTTFGTDIIVSVPPAITSNAAGNINTGASYFVHYVPNIEPLKVVSIVVMAAFAGTLASSWLTSLVVSSMHPSATAGSLGFGAIGFILWAQKLYLIGLTSSPALPANYRIVSDFFSWTSFLLGTPWTWGVSPVPGIPRNLTSSSSVFPMDALVVLDSETLNYVYYYPSSVGGQRTPITSPSPPSQASASGGPINEGTVAAGPFSAATMQSPAEVPVSTAQDSCTLSKDTDLVGGDLPNATFVATNPKDCCAACLATSSCYAWTLSSVQNKCYLKAESGWQLHANDTCCMSGTANREGVIVALPNISPPSINLSGGGLGKKASITNYGNGNPPTFRGPAGSIGSRKLLEQLPFSHNSRNLLQDKASNSSLSGNSSERGYIVASTAPSAELLSPSTAVMQYSDAGEKTKFIIDMAVPDKLSQAYGRLESIGFWFGCVFILACAFNFSAWMVVKCRNKETPGVLYVPRMQLILLMSLMPPLAYVGSILLVNKSGVIPLVVGITVVVCGPLLFLTASASGIAVALYRKRKTVYLLSNQYSGQNTMHYSRWELVFVAQVMGMSLNRGKWRPESSRKNEFVFRFGPLFEDCRGPLYQRQKVTSDAGTASLRRTHACHGSARSLQNALPAGHDGDACRASHLNNLMAIEEKPLTTCGRVRVLRSSYQAYGVVMAIARLAAYALTIGLLDRWPAVQSGVLLGLGIVYFVYLRFAVPYSRRDEMALEYWQALLDIILFVLLLVLSLAIDATNSVQVNNMGIGMLVVQGLGFISYFINRSLIVVHAFHEIVCPHWTMAVRRPWKTTKKKKIQRRSLSNDGSISLDGVEVPLSVRCVCRDFNGTCHRSNDEQMRLKTSNSNGKKCEAHRQNICAGENQSISEGRNPRPGMVPSIAENRPMLHEEETLSVRLTGNRRSTEKRSSSGAMSVHICGPSSCVPQYLPPASGITEALQDSGASLEEGEKAERHAVPDPLKAGENDIFDRFWKSI